MAEWPNAVVLKTIEPKGSGGSNPSLSAIASPSPLRSVDALRLLMAGHSIAEPQFAMILSDGLQRVECPEPVEGLSWVYMLLMRNGMLCVGANSRCL